MRSCPRDTRYGETVCRNGLLWSLTYSEMGPPDQRQCVGECGWPGHQEDGVNAAPVIPVGGEQPPTFVLYETALMETPQKREGYEDARQGLPPQDTRYGRREALKYEEGRFIYAVLMADYGKVPKWLSERPPVKLVRLCLNWDKTHPGEMLLPVVETERQTKATNDPYEKAY